MVHTGYHQSAIGQHGSRVSSSLVENHEEDLDDAFPPDPQVNSPDEQVEPTSNKTVPPLSPSIRNFMDLTKYSTLSKLLRVTSYILRFIHNKRNPSDQRKGPLTVAELTSSQQKWIVDRQHHRCATELACISSPTKSRPPLTRQLRLFIDDNDLLVATLLLCCYVVAGGFITHL